MDNNEGAIEAQSSTAPGERNNRRAHEQTYESNVWLCDRPLILEADRRREILLVQLGNLESINDPRVLLGLLIVCAADFSAVLCETFLNAIKHVANTAQVRNKLPPSLELTHRGNDGEPTYLRRWHLDPAATYILERLRKIKRKRYPDTDSCVEEAGRWLGIEDLSTRTLARSATAWWSTHLPPWLISYATVPALSPSLPHRANLRLRTGRNSSGPTPRHTSTEPNTEPGPGGRYQVQDGAAADRDRIRSAERALARALRQVPGQRKATADELGKRLDGWMKKHAGVGSWPLWLCHWARWKLVNSNKNTRLRASTVVRYLDGFAMNFCELMADLPPSLAIKEPDALADRLERLGEILMLRTSAKMASPVKAGLLSFIDFVGACGGPEIKLGSDWRLLASPSDVDVNILTPSEYSKVLSQLRERKDSDYEKQRLVVMTILAFRLGPRWEELSTRKIDDLVIDQHDPIGYLRIEANEYIHGKSESFRRKLPLDGLVPIVEIDAIRAFKTLAVGQGRTGSDCLFSEADDPARPPTQSRTHDVILTCMRNVSGDASLVFHHLRHSFATYLQVRCESNQVLERQFLDQIPGWDSVSSTVVCPGKHQVTALTHRCQTDPSRAYIISHLLGHLGPATSMRSYLHLADMLLASSCQPWNRLPDRTLAKLDRVQADSVRRRLHRQNVRSGKTRRTPTGEIIAPAGVSN